MSKLAATALGGLCALGWNFRAAADTFEELANPAAAVSDLGMLLLPFVQDCKKPGSELDRARCGAINRFLVARLPEQTFRAPVDGPSSVSVSEYDARLKGVSLTVAGCLACTQPVDAAGERLFVTLAAPGAGARPLARSVELWRTALSFSGVAESTAWLASVRPHLRAEMVFRPANAPWTRGRARGYAFKPLGVRVWNRCTGEIVFSQPRSSGPARKDDCPAPGEAASEPLAAPEGASESLDSAEITRALAAVSADLAECVRQFPMHGKSLLVFEVGGNGAPRKVLVEGAAAGTALAKCLVDVAMQARFPSSSAVQRFKYPVPAKQAK